VTSPAWPGIGGPWLGGGGGGAGEFVIPFAPQPTSEITKTWSTNGQGPIHFDECFQFRIATAKVLKTSISLLGSQRRAPSFERRGAGALRHTHRSGWVDVQSPTTPSLIVITQSSQRFLHITEFREQDTRNVDWFPKVSDQRHFGCTVRQFSICEYSRNSYQR
jgi:hypothetical protein